MLKEFQVHKVNEEGFRQAGRIALAFSNLLSDLESFLPVSRELSIVRTKLEEACFYSKKAMANLPEYQDVETKS
jgi:hypothetical protein